MNSKPSGETIIKLSKQEESCLRKSQGVCNMLARHNVDDGTAARISVDIELLFGKLRNVTETPTKPY